VRRERFNALTHGVGWLSALIDSGALVAVAAHREQARLAPYLEI